MEHLTPTQEKFVEFVYHCIDLNMVPTPTMICIHMGWNGAYGDQRSINGWYSARRIKMLTDAGYTKKGSQFGGRWIPPTTS